MKRVMSILKWEIPCGNSNQLVQRFDMLRGVSYVCIYLRLRPPEKQTEGAPASFESHATRRIGKLVITRMSDVLSQNALCYVRQRNACLI